MLRDDIAALKYIPWQLQEIKELQYAYSTSEDDIQECDEAADTVLNNMFVETADEDGVSRFEQIFGIEPKASDTLSDRKFRLLTRLNQQTPYSFKKLEQQLTTLCGAEGFTLQRVLNTFQLVVKVALTAKSNYGDVVALLENTVPANMVIELSLMYNQHSTLAAFTHAQLASYTHDELRNEVIS